MNELKMDEDMTADTERMKFGHIGEVAEAKRLEQAAGEIAKIDELRTEAWSQLDETSREWSLRRVGQCLMSTYECPAPPFVGSQMAESDQGILLGAYSDTEYVTWLNRELLKQNDASSAIETFSHEFRHAYQNEMVERYNSSFRHLCHDQAEAAQWAENLKPGNYISFEDDPAGYEVQPVEQDARDFAERLQHEIRRYRDA